MRDDLVRPLTTDDTNGVRGDWAEAARSALVADALDAVGYRQQCLGWDLGPLAPQQRVLSRAFPVQAVDTPDTHPQRPYAGLLRALDDIRAGSVFVLGTGRSTASGVWGELLTTACLAAGVVGRSPTAWSATCRRSSSPGSRCSAAGPRPTTARAGSRSSSTADRSPW